MLEIACGQWMIVGEGETPDFHIADDSGTFGLEVTQAFTDNERGASSNLRQAEGAAIKSMDRIRRAFEKRTGTTINATFTKRPQPAHEDEIVQRLVEIGLEAEAIETVTEVTLADGMKIRARRSDQAQPLRTGRPSKAFKGMLPREIWANWLLCAAINGATGRDNLEFTTDPTGGDGIIWDTSTNETWPTEHVFVPPVRDDDSASTEMLILAAIKAKNDKGALAYAGGKTLVVFVDAGAGAWFPNRILRGLPEPLHFDLVWLISLHGVAEDGSYSYDVVGLYWDGGNAPTWRISISPDFLTWRVQRVQ